MSRAAAAAAAAYKDRPRSPRRRGQHSQSPPRARAAPELSVLHSAAAFSSSGRPSAEGFTLSDSWVAAPRKRGSASTTPRAQKDNADASAARRFVVADPSRSPRHATGR